MTLKAGDHVVLSSSEDFVCESKEIFIPFRNSRST
jgi:hypothetical protein